MSVSTEMPFSAASACRASIISVSLMASRPSCSSMVVAAAPPAFAAAGRRPLPGFGAGPTRTRCGPGRCRRRPAARRRRAVRTVTPSSSAATTSPSRRRSPPWAAPPAAVSLTVTDSPTARAKWRGRAQAALEAGAADLEGVGPGDGVGLVERAGHGAGGVGEHVEVEAGRAVDDHLQRPDRRPRCRTARGRARSGGAARCRARGRRRSSGLASFLSYERRGHRAHAFARTSRTVTNP